MRVLGVAGPPLTKGRPKLLKKREQARIVVNIDRGERIKCRQRSDGRCEVVERGVRCNRRMAENHHMLSGIGRRNNGRSILAAHRIDVCSRCHRDITGHVLKPNSDTFSADLRFERVR